MGVECDARLEHRGVVGRFAAGEAEVGATQRLEGAHRVGKAVVPGGGQHSGEALETAQRHFRQQRVGVAEMPVRRGGTDAGEPRRLGDGEAGRALLGDQRQRRLDQRLAQIAVMVAAAFEAALPGPAHVKEFYITRAGDPSAAMALSGLPLFEIEHHRT